MHGIYLNGIKYKSPQIPVPYWHKKKFKKLIKCTQTIPQAVLGTQLSICGTGEVGNGCLPQLMARRHVFKRSVSSIMGDNMSPCSQSRIDTPAKWLSLTTVLTVLVVLIVQQDPQKEMQVEQEQSAGAENQSALAGENLEESSSRHVLSVGLGRMIPRHRRRPSQESIVSEMSSAPGSELSRGVSVDVPLETSFWGYSATDRSNGEGGSVSGAESEYLKGVGLILPVDQRSKVRRVMMVLQRRLAVVKTDMEDLLARLNQETAVKEFLTTKVIVA